MKNSFITLAIVRDMAWPGLIQTPFHKLYLFKNLLQFFWFIRTVFIKVSFPLTSIIASVTTTAM